MRYRSVTISDTKRGEYPQTFTSPYRSISRFIIHVYPTESGTNAKTELARIPRPRATPPHIAIVAIESKFQAYANAEPAPVGRLTAPGPSVVEEHTGAGDSEAASAPVLEAPTAERHLCRVHPIMS